jgi:hypothetical protein
MKYLKICVLTILILLFGYIIYDRPTTEEGDSCKVLKTVNNIEKHHFSIKDHKKIDFNKFKLIDSLTYHKLNGHEKVVGECNYYYGKFFISKNRFGLICFNKSRECDNDVYYFSLHIIDNCTNKKEFIYLTTEDHHGLLYQLSSSFSKDFSQLSTTLKQTSEWINDESKTDTLFTEIYKINLKSTNLDTLSVTKTFKIIKR